MLKEQIVKRSLPRLPARDDIVRILLENEYGVLPDTAFEMRVSPPVSVERGYCAGRAEHSYVELTVAANGRSHSFRVDRLLHADGEKHPFFIHIGFYPELPNRHCPLELLAEEGFSLLSVYYRDVTSDNADFGNGLAGVLLPNGQEGEDTCGKLGIWAFAVMRLLDYAETLAGLDLAQAAVIGHSRLGKTALLAAMADERFRFAFSNDSGCSGAALARGNSGLERLKGRKDAGGGETIADITRQFPHWFCKKYRSFAKDGTPPAFDQHFLLASIAPRFAYVASASMDDWADPTSEFLSCVAASEGYERLGYHGLVTEDRLPRVGEYLHEGRIGYHLREGVHFLSMKDWALYMQYMRRHAGDGNKEK